MNEMIQSIPKIKIQYEKTMLLYQAAMEEVLTRINILNREFKIENSYSPIEHISSRIKTPKSIYKKLQKHNLAMTMENMMRHVHDIAGIRIVCKFTSDIYSLVNLLGFSISYSSLTTSTSIPNSSFISLIVPSSNVSSPSRPPPGNV